MTHCEVEKVFIDSLESDVGQLVTVISHTDSPDWGAAARAAQPCAADESVHILLNYTCDQTTPCKTPIYRTNTARQSAEFPNKFCQSNF